eukprot:12858563-Alexandrium_andersonii.AAC.1
MVLSRSRRQQVDNSALGRREQFRGVSCAPLRQRRPRAGSAAHFRADPESDNNNGRACGAPEGTG